MTLCPACATAQPDEAHFCFSCGAPLTPAACASCGSRLISGASFCGECGAPQAGAAPRASSEMAARPVSSRRVTSVLFGDLVGFTTLSETRDHEETRELLTRYFDECRQVIGRYGGTVEKFIGDAVMAVWGVPTSHEDDAERAVRAGLELAVAVAAMGQDVGVPELAMRVGIVTGEVAVTIGAEHQGMVAGDAVNTAARVQSVAEPGQVWVDETTRLLTSSAITYLDVGFPPPQGQGRTGPPVVGPRGGGLGRRSTARRRPGGPAGRTRPRAPAAQGALPRCRGAPASRPAGAGGRARARQVAPAAGSSRSTSTA